MDWSKFIKVLRDIRVAPGKIYVDQVSERIKLIGEPVSKSADPDKVVDTINRCLTAGKDKPEDFFIQEKVGQYFKEDPDTKEVYSVPSKRMQLDEWIKEEIKEYEYRSLCVNIILPTFIFGFEIVVR